MKIPASPFSLLAVLSIVSCVWFVFSFFSSSHFPHISLFSQHHQDGGVKTPHLGLPRTRSQLPLLHRHRRLAHHHRPLSPDDSFWHRLPHPSPLLLSPQFFRYVYWSFHDLDAFGRCPALCAYNPHRGSSRSKTGSHWWINFDGCLGSHVFVF